MRKFPAVFAAALLAASFCAPQSAPKSAPQSDAKPAPLPRGYGGVSLGMSMQSAKDALKKNNAFGYHGERDVSLLPGGDRALIETSARAGHVDSFLERCYFQFDGDSLCVIIINMNREKIDHYSVFSALREKYGDPSSIDPEKSVWTDGSVTMSLERPLALKYIDSEKLEKIDEDSLVEKTGHEMTREMFLEGL